MATDLTPEARVGYDGNPNTHMATRPRTRRLPARFRPVCAPTEHKAADGLRVTFERVA